jgi:hypothetical protein
MSKKSSKSTQHSRGATYQNFIRYSNITFFVLLSSLLMVAAILLITMISGIEQSGSQAAPISASFDEATIKKLKSLSNTDSPAANSFPAGRINPFIE